MALTSQAATPLFPVAQAESIVGILGWSIVLIVFLVGMFMAVSWLKKWMKSDDEFGPVGTGLTLSDLRQIHSRGEMTDEEYERARAKMMASAKAQTANMPDPAGGRRAPGAPPPPGSTPRSPPPRPPPPPAPPAT